MGISSASLIAPRIGLAVVLHLQQNGNIQFCQKCLQNFVLFESFMWHGQSFHSTWDTFMTACVRLTDSEKALRAPIVSVHLTERTTDCGLSALVALFQRVPFHEPARHHAALQGIA